MRSLNQATCIEVINNKLTTYKGIHYIGSLQVILILKFHPIRRHFSENKEFSDRRTESPILFR